MTVCAKITQTEKKVWLSWEGIMLYLLERHASRGFKNYWNINSKKIWANVFLGLEIQAIHIWNPSKGSFLLYAIAEISLMLSGLGSARILE